MSKQLLMNERPADVPSSVGGGGNGGGEDWPKASIGNYKGVMLCNRPNEAGAQRKADRTGTGLPFNSRVIHDEPVGWNPTRKLAPKLIGRKKKVDPNNALLKHKKFLKNLEEQRVKDKEDRAMEDADKEEKATKFKEIAEKQRKKISEMKRNGGVPGAAGNTSDDEGAELTPPKADEEQRAIQSKLTEENLRKSDQIESESRKGGAKKSKQSKKAKPAWALTMKEEEEQKEKEIDDLLEFAYELDYEKFMDDFEVRQALAIIKDRVSEIKKDVDWKNKMAQEWNEAATGEEENVQKVDDPMETRSAVSYNSSKTAASKKSLRSQVLEAIQEEGQNKPDWDKSVKGDKNTTEDRIALRLATEVLRDNAKLRGVHSATSIKRLLEKEAKKQLMAFDGYKGPVVSVIKDKEIKKDELDPSYLPYLHKNPAI